jgi:hypothetical protein
MPLARSTSAGDARIPIIGERAATFHATRTAVTRVVISMEIANEMVMTKDQQTIIIVRPAAGQKEAAKTSATSAENAQLVNAAGTA